MALQADSWFSKSTLGALGNRLIPDQRPDSVKVATFAGGTAETLPVGTPVYVAAATGFVAKLIASGTTEQLEVWGFVYQQPVTTKASGEVLGTIMTRGQASYGDLRLLLNAVVSGQPLAGTETQFKTCLRKSIVRERGLFINGLDLLGGP